MENIIPKGKNTIIAHLKHLKEHGEQHYLKQALEVLKEKNIEIDFDEFLHDQTCCHGIEVKQKKQKLRKKEKTKVESCLTQWPVQLTLISPSMPYFKNADLLLVADCVAYACGNFHNDFLDGKKIAIACPKLDDRYQSYVEKIRLLIDQSGIRSLTVVIMEVPCCRGLLLMAQEANEKAKRKIPLNLKVVGINGEIVSQETISK